MHVRAADCNPVGHSHTKSLEISFPKWLCWKQRTGVMLSGHHQLGSQQVLGKGEHYKQDAPSHRALNNCALVYWHQWRLRQLWPTLALTLPCAYHPVPAMSNPDRPVFSALQPHWSRAPQLFSLLAFLNFTTNY